MAQNISWLGANYTGVPYVTLPKTGGGTAKFSDASITTATASDVASGKKFLLADGSEGTGTNSGGGGSSMNVQVAQSTTRVANTAYTKTASLTCAVSGTYDVYWDCFRSTTSGTSGSQLHIGGSSYGSANTNANQEVSVYVRSRATNYYAYCGQLTIVQTS